CRIDLIKPKPAALIWRPPSYGCLKFNVFGIVNEDRSGCGCVLRDKEGVARALFSGSIAANDTDLAEIGTVMVALEVFLAMKWKLNDSLFLELGSIVVFNWCANKSMRPWVGLENGNLYHYRVTNFIYAATSVDEVVCFGYVAVATGEGKTPLEVRDILVSWGGTIIMLNFLNTFGLCSGCRGSPTSNNNLSSFLIHYCDESFLFCLPIGIVGTIQRWRTCN
ncbi:hypothetical protein Goari_026756, partial [Gossypium aridum]|nr:hypothetical protein [Gossypium aridum]